ncbi:hypothetical protein, partial [Sphingobium yanoikuyae]
YYAETLIPDFPNGLLHHHPLRYPSDEGQNIDRSAATKMWGGFGAYRTSDRWQEMAVFVRVAERGS